MRAYRALFSHPPPPPASAAATCRHGSSFCTCRRVAIARSGLFSLAVLSLRRKRAAPRSSPASTAAGADAVLTRGEHIEAIALTTGRLRVRREAARHLPVTARCNCARRARHVPFTLCSCARILPLLASARRGQRRTTAAIIAAGVSRHVRRSRCMSLALRSGQALPGTCMERAAPRGRASAAAGASLSRKAQG